MAYKRLGEILLQSNAITLAQLNQALAVQQNTGQRLGEILCASGAISRMQLIQALCIQQGVEYVDLTLLQLPGELASLVPRGMAMRHRLVPVELSGKILRVAMEDPLDFVALEEVKAASHKQVEPLIATAYGIEQAIRGLYGEERTARALEQMCQEVEEETQTPGAVPLLPQNAEETAPTIRFVNSVIQRAVELHASDIHVEPQEEELVVRMRIDGRLHRMFTVPSNLHGAVISRLKIMGGMNISQRKLPQDGRAVLQYQGKTLDLRVSSIPTIYGEKVVLRLLDRSSGQRLGDTIGLEGENRELFYRLLSNTSGMILIVGPTGSGKSTTMCAMLQELSKEETNIVTLEDPVEYHIPGVNQCQINEKIGMTFASGLRSVLRQDPDVISVGEIRDTETGKIAVRAAITGHLVLSTLHTGDALSAIDRLVDIGVEPYFVSGALRGILSQRLVRKLCPCCKRAYTPSRGEADFLGIDREEHVRFYAPQGCPECLHTGTKGRRGVFEILTITPSIRRMIAEGARAEALRESAIAQGFVPFKDVCRDLVMRGEISLDEAARVIQSAT